MLLNDKSKRRISARIELTFFESEIYISATDEEGNYAEMNIPNTFDMSSNKELVMRNIEKQLSKSGNTIFEITSIKLYNNEIPFIPLSELNYIRNSILEELSAQRKLSYKKKVAGSIAEIPQYFEKSIDYRGNVMNSLSRKIYEEAGVKSIEEAFEKGTEFDGKVVMTTKYCLKYELGICPVHQKEGMSEFEYRKRNDKLFLEDNNHIYRLEFDCKKCEMKVIY
jgi:putative protease